MKRLLPMAMFAGGVLAFALIAAVAARSAPQQAQEQTWTVNAAGDEADANIGDGTCATAASTCTLRAAISEANNHPGPDSIHFNITGTGPHTIRLGSSLPNLSDDAGRTRIDGYTQPGAVPNTDPVASNAKIMIQLEGRGAESFPALSVNSSNNVIRGLAFYNLERAVNVAVSTQNRNAPADNNRIVGCFIGINAAGVTPYTDGGVTTGAYGIYVGNRAANTLIGSAAVADRNVISGNAQDGIFVIDPGTNATRIVNNIIGLDPTGTRRVRNWSDGIDIGRGAQYTVVGGQEPGERNVISGNEGEGVEISHFITTTLNLVSGNFIGTDLSGNNSRPAATLNRGFGISLEDRVANNTIGPGNVIANNRRGGIYVSGISDNPSPGLVPEAAAEPQQAPGGAAGNRIVGNTIGLDAAGRPAGNGFGENVPGDGIWLNTNTQRTHVEGNTISQNRGAGVRIVGPASDFNTVTRNSFSNNTGLAIDLVPAGGTPPTPCTDVNECINSPVITDATTARVTGTACAGCTVEVYIVDGGGDQRGEGRDFLVSARANDAGRWEAGMPLRAANNFVTALAIDAQGNTSEFSNNVPVRLAPTATPTATPTNTPTSTPTRTPTPTSGPSYLPLVMQGPRTGLAPAAQATPGPSARPAR